MSVLQRNSKPQVDFDPANKQHRKAYCNFVQSGKWGEDAPKFFVDFPHTNLKDMLSAKVSAYYLNKEFK